MRHVAAPIAVLLASQASFAIAGADAALTQWLGDAARITRTARDLVVEYCPDNTCERLVSRKPKAIREFEDFAFLYLATRSEYVYLKDSRPPAVDDQVRTIVRAYGLLCSDIESPKCTETVLKHLQARTGATLSFVRFDEGHKCTVPQPLLGTKPRDRPRCVKVAGAALYRSKDRKEE